MTPERFAEIVASIERGDTWDRTAVALVREVQRLRALPVLATCGECRWCHESAGGTCMHDRAHIEHEIDGADRPPPTWCPLRGAR